MRKALSILTIATVLLFAISAVAASVVVIPLGTAKHYLYWQGDWATDTTYKVGDAVHMDGSSYLCVTEHTSTAGDSPPNATYWDLIAAEGAQGPQGLTGAPGSAPVNWIGDWQEGFTYAAIDNVQHNGNSYICKLSHTSTAIDAPPDPTYWSLMASAGAVGPTGTQGPPGSDGSNGTDGADGADGADGTQGPPGSNGSNGADGADGTQGPPGSNGSNGADGADGTQGPPGSNGADGADGLQGPEGPQGSISANTTIRTLESDGNIASAVTSEVVSLSCNSDEVITGATCSASSTNFNSATTNWGVIHFCGMAGNGVVGGAYAYTLSYEGTKSGPPLTVYAVCVKTVNPSLQVAGVVEVIEPSLELQAVKDKLEQEMKTLQQAYESK